MDAQVDLAAPALRIQTLADLGARAIEAAEEEQHQDIVMTDAEILGQSQAPLATQTLALAQMLAPQELQCALILTIMQIVEYGILADARHGA